MRNIASPRRSLPAFKYLCMRIYLLFVFCLCVGDTAKQDRGRRIHTNMLLLLLLMLMLILFICAGPEGSKSNHKYYLYYIRFAFTDFVIYTIVSLVRGGKLSDLFRS